MMTPAPADPALVAVLDVGKTNVKVVLFDGRTEREVFARTMPNTVLEDGPYRHFDIPRIEAFFVDSLVDVVRQAGAELRAVSVTTHGACGALIGPDGLALPVLDYEDDGPDSVRDAYERIRPGFDETFSPRLPGGLNLGAQLFWQAKRFPDAFATATFVTYPQFWSWWLTGVAANEPTSLGAHSDLWAPRERRFSSLVAAAGWTDHMAPLRSAFDVLGPVRPALAARLGLTGGGLPVTCGIHDSNASLLPHIQGAAAPLTIVSTGTWAIVFAVGGSIDRLDPLRDTLANVDATGRATPSARFMGGREFDLLTRGVTVEPDAGALAAVLVRGVMALPTFAPGNGPFPTGQGRWSHDPEGLSAAERSVVASLYVALMTATCLELLDARGPTIIEGPFARNALFRDALAALTGRLLAASEGTGTSAGAARLALPERARPGSSPSPPATSFDLGPAFAAYAERWRREAGRTPTG